MSDYTGASSVPDTVDITARNSRGNPESADANLKAAERKAKYRRMVYDWWECQGATGMLAEDALHAFPQLRYSTVTARISELRRDGMLVQIGLRPTAYSGKNAAVLVAQKFAKEVANGRPETV